VDAVMGKTNRYGEPEEDVVTSLLYMAGLNLRPISKNARSIKMRQMIKAEQGIQSQMTSSRLAKDKSAKEKKRDRERFRKRIQLAREERRKYAAATI